MRVEGEYIVTDWREAERNGDRVAILELHCSPAEDRPSAPRYAEVELYDIEAAGLLVNARARLVLRITDCPRCD